MTARSPSRHPVGGPGRGKWGFVGSHAGQGPTRALATHWVPALRKHRSGSSRGSVPGQLYPPRHFQLESCRGTQSSAAGRRAGRSGCKARARRVRPPSSGPHRQRLGSASLRSGGRPVLRRPSTRSVPRGRALSSGSRTRVSSPEAAAVQVAPLAKTHVDNTRRAPREFRRSPAPTTVSSESPAARRPTLQSLRREAAEPKREPPARSSQHARPPSGRWLVPAMQPLRRPARFQPGHQAAGRAPRLQRSLRSPPPPGFSAKGGPAPAAAKFSPDPEANVHAAESARQLGLPPWAGHVEGESRLLPRDAGSPPLLLPPPAPLAPLTLTRGFTLASKPARPARAERRGLREPEWPRTWAGPPPLSQSRSPRQRGALTQAGRSQCWPSLRPLPAASLRPPACAPPPPARPASSGGLRCQRSCGVPTPANGERPDAEIGKPPPKVGGKESGGPGCQSK